MRVIKSVRQDILETSLWVLIENSFVLTIGIIEFFDAAGVSLCELSFDDYQMAPTATGNAILRLKSIDGSYVLKGTAHTTGIVASFKILGTDPSKVLPNSNYIITGTVGSLTSSADLRFNITSWSNTTFVTIENFDIIIPDGV